MMRFSFLDIYGSFLLIILGSLLHNNFPTESRKVSPNGIVIDNFKTDAFRRITTHLIETIIVSRLGLCSFKCVQNVECLSFNFGNPVKGTHVCELLRTDKYNARPSYSTSTNFHYFFPGVSLESQCCNFCFGLFVNLAQREPSDRRYRGMYLSLYIEMS